jgi:hypothetical protein
MAPGAGLCHSKKYLAHIVVPCSPRSKLMENLGDEIRGKWYPNQAYLSIQAVEDTLAETLVTLGNYTGRKVLRPILI